MISLLTSDPTKAEVPKGWGQLSPVGTHAHKECGGRKLGRSEGTWAWDYFNSVECNGARIQMRPLCMAGH